MEQGTKKVSDAPAFAEAAGALGDQLASSSRATSVARAVSPAAAARRSARAPRRTSCCLDDDVVCEPEGVIRAITFGDLARRPTIVGGHMFSIYSRPACTRFGEIINRSASGGCRRPRQQRLGLRRPQPALLALAAQRVDVDFNGWFMCLIPRAGRSSRSACSLPLFIKWDDSEFGLRAKAAGFPTVSFPGAAVWHVPWTDKNDALDWQSYFHQRNRFVAALLHSPYPKGGRMIRESFNHQVKHLVSMQYSTAELRHQALEDVLAGPGAAAR